MKYKESKEVLEEMKQEYKTKGMRVNYKGIKSSNSKEIDVTLTSESSLRFSIFLGSDILSAYYCSLASEEDFQKVEDFYETYLKKQNKERKIVLQYYGDLKNKGYVHDKDRGRFTLTKAEKKQLEDIRQKVNELKKVNPYLYEDLSFVLNRDGVSVFLTYQTMKQKTNIEIKISGEDVNPGVCHMRLAGERTFEFNQDIKKGIQSIYEKRENNEEELQLYTLEKLMLELLLYRTDELDGMKKVLCECMEREKIEELAQSYIQNGYQEFLYTGVENVGWFSFGETYITVDKGVMKLFHDKQQSMQHLLRVCEDNYMKEYSL